MNGEGDDQGRDILEDENRVDRRGYLKLVAASAVLTAGTTAQTVLFKRPATGMAREATDKHRMAEVQLKSRL